MRLADVAHLSRRAGASYTKATSQGYFTGLEAHFAGRISRGAMLSCPCVGCGARRAERWPWEGVPRVDECMMMCRLVGGARRCGRGVWIWPCGHTSAHGNPCYWGRRTRRPPLLDVSATARTAGRGSRTTERTGLMAGQLATCYGYMLGPPRHWHRRFVTTAVLTRDGQRLPLAQRTTHTACVIH